MNKLLQHRTLIRENIIVLIGICLCFYFTYHALQGNRSVIRLLALDHSITVMSQQYEEGKAERIALETKVKAMRPGSISRDLLEERARAVLGYRHPDEMIMLTPGQE
jgi:cell division protein FtsB